MTIKEIATLAGVSISTVSKIINNKDEHINNETRNRVLNIVKEYNYSPYSKAIQANTSKSFIIGILLHSITASHLLIKGIMNIAQEHGYSILLFENSKSNEEELKNMTTLCKRNIDGVIWEPLNADSLLQQHHFTNQNIEICYINTLLDKSSHCIDFEQMGYEMTKQLLQLQHTHLACMITPNSILSSKVLEGFKKCLFEYHISYDDSMCLLDDNYDCYTHIIGNKTTGIVSSDYDCSLRLYQALEHLHYRIPSDLSIISLGTGTHEINLFPKLSTLKIPYIAFGEFICKDLICKCEKSTPLTKDFYIKPQLNHTFSISTPMYSHSQRIVVVGSINIDITLNFEHLPRPGITVTTSNCSICPGGKGINQAIGIKKLGGESTLIGKVGNDYDSTLIYNVIKDYQVDGVGVSRDHSSATGKAYIQVQNNGESIISILSGANAHLMPDDIYEYQKLFDSASYCLIQTEIPKETVELAVSLAIRAGAKVILKPAVVTSISDTLLQNIDFFIPNRLEAELLCPHLISLEEKATFFLSKGVKTVIITLGSEGCYVKTHDFSSYYPAVTSITVDATGAADAFIAAFAVYISKGYSLDKSIRIATYAASFCIARQGVVPALVDKNTLELYIKRFETNLIE